MNRMRTYLLLGLMIGLLVSACAPQEAPTPTPAVVLRLLATAFYSPTPSDAEREATRQAASPTPAPTLPTVEPSATPYVGVFIGRAERENNLVAITEPIFGRSNPGAAPTANPGRCGIPIDTAYADAWRTQPSVSERLGCPIQAGFGFFGEVQFFENGLMYRRPETREIWAILSTGRSGRHWAIEAPQSASTVGLQAPRGLIVPGGDFGSLWLGVDGLRALIGWALAEPIRIPMGMQRFESGTMLLDASGEQVYALVADGLLYGPFQAPDLAVEEAQNAPTPFEIPPGEIDGP